MRPGQSIALGEQWGRLSYFLGADRAMVVLDDGRKEEWMVVPLESLAQVPLAVREKGMEEVNKGKEEKQTMPNICHVCEKPTDPETDEIVQGGFDEAGRWRTAHAHVACGLLGEPAIQDNIFDRPPDYVYTQEQAMAETQTMEGKPGHIHGCTTYAACLAKNCQCGCHD